MANSGITILPYIDQSAQTITDTKPNLKTTSNSPVSNDSDQQNTAFDEVLTCAQKAAAVLAADSLVSSSESGTVTTSDMQNFLTENHISIALAPINVSTSADSADTNPSESVSANTGSTTADTASANYSNTGNLTCSDELEAYFKEAADTYGVDIKFLKAIAKQESNFNTNATSKSGAMGIMQLMPFTAKELGVSNAYDAKSNIMGGAKLISSLLDKYNGDKTLALAAYNAGSSNVDKYGGLPPFNETQNYVQKVLNYYQS